MLLLLLVSTLVLVSFQQLDESIAVKSSIDIPLKHPIHVFLGVDTRNIQPNDKLYFSLSYQPTPIDIFSLYIYSDLTNYTIFWADDDSCWRKDLSLSRQACCIENLTGCWDHEFTIDRCCHARWRFLNSIPDVDSDQINSIPARMFLNIVTPLLPNYTSYGNLEGFNQRRHVYRIGSNYKLPNITDGDGSQTLVDLYSLYSGGGIFVNIGSGGFGILNKDPLTMVAEKYNMRGVLIDAKEKPDISDRWLNYSISNMVVTPSNVREIVIGALKEDTHVDILKIDIDSWDCILLKELLPYLSINIIHLELIMSIPPPFKFARLYSRKMNSNFNSKQMSSTVSCSLSYAVNLLSQYDFYLFKILDNGNDAIFIHKRLKFAVEDAYQIKLPIDEFEAYRRHDNLLIIGYLFI